MVSKISSIPRQCGTSLTCPCQLDHAQRSTCRIDLAPALTLYEHRLLLFGARTGTVSHSSLHPSRPFRRSMAMDPTHLDPSSALEHDRPPSRDAHGTPRAGGLRGSRSPAPVHSRGVKKLILCFDGTGNKFHGDDSDSNILKIFRMLDREADDQYHYYQRWSPTSSFPHQDN